MKSVTLDVRSPSDAMGDFTQAWKTGKAQKSARISFATPELLWQVLTAKRWELLKALCGAGPVSIRKFPFEAVKVEFLLRAASDRGAGPRRAQCGRPGSPPPRG